MASPDEKNSRDKNIWMQIGRYSHLALVLPASAVVGLFLGMALDRWLKTSWIAIVGLVVGCVAGITELTRALIRISKES